MRERPILFSGPMVRAILDGKKTQTRRPIKASGPWDVYEGRDMDPWPLRGPGQGARVPCPYGFPGDRLWVRETWQPGYTHTSVSSGGADVSTCEVIYKADNASMKRPAPDDVAEKWDRLYSDDGPDDPRWRPSIHMPRWASRLKLEVVSVRVERLNDISEEDARAEGVAPFFEVYKGMGQEQTISTGERAADAPHRASFACLWDEINGDRALWKSNPWVWVVEFRRATPGAAKEDPAP